MALQSTLRRRTEPKGSGDGWVYVMLAIVVLAAVVLVIQIGPYA